MSLPQHLIAIVPAAGVGSRMQADRPKQYLSLHGQTVLEHTVYKLLSHPSIEQVIVAISEDDPYFADLALASHPQVTRVNGGKERADSVLSALRYLSSQDHQGKVLVHDAARPCVRMADIDRLIDCAMHHPVGAILASPVRDTMKRSNAHQQIDHTVDRAQLWHALTPQMFDGKALAQALEQAMVAQVTITDEASAFEWLGKSPALVTGAADNLKITQPEDLALAEYYLSRERGE